ncbi:MAG: hypothetical protein O3A47_05475 [Chloroflexi bacterium]|nr:hypothetical protein [Chloroflexota bacterium]
MARSAVEGAIETSKSIGVDATAAAAAVAVEAAYDVSDAAGDAVREAATGTIMGVRVTVSTAVGGKKE